MEIIANGGSFLEGFEDGALSGAISGAIGGAAFAGLGQLGAVAGKGIKCMSGFGKFIKGTASVTKVMSTAMGGFDTIALVDKAFGNGDIATLNAKLHESKAYNIFQTGVTAHRRIYRWYDYNNEMLCCRYTCSYRKRLGCN